MSAAHDVSPYAHAFAAAGLPDDPIPAAPTLREQARIYQAAGFRTLRARPNKTPAEPKDSFRRDKPGATRRYQAFPAATTGGVIILCGALSYGGSRELLGLDRDGAMTWAQLEAELGCALPPTLSSKGDRHRLYWLPAGHSIRQGNGTLTCDGGQLDIRPDHGGYLYEPWQWDDGFDAARIADFPDVEALRRVRHPASKSEPATEAGVDGLPEPRELTEDEYAQLLEAAANAFPAGGGGTGLHDACKALGGVGRRAGIAREQIVALALDVAQQVGSESSRTRAHGAGDAWDRCHRGESAFGVPTLREKCGEGEAWDALSGVLRELTPEDQWLAGVAEQWRQRGANDTAGTAGAPGKPLPFEALTLPPSPVENDTAVPFDDASAYGITPHVDDDYALSALAGWVVEHIRALRCQIRTPLAMNIGNALGAMSCAIQGRVRPVSFDGFVSHACLYMGVVAEPGERKTSAHNHAMAPIKAWAREKQDAERDSLEQRRMKREKLEADVKRLAKAWADGYDDDPNAPEAAELRQKRIELEAMADVVPFEYLVEDCTPEALVDLLATHGRLALVSSDAACVFDAALGKYNKGQVSITPMVKAYDGEWVDVRRVGRETVKAQHDQTTLSAVLSIQPQVLNDLTGNDAFVGQGFAARMGWIVCEPAGPRAVGERIPQEVLEEYDRGMRAMLELSGEVRLSPEAARDLRDWHDEIEHRSRTKNGDLNGEMQAWASKHVDRTLRIAACLWAADAVYGGAPGPISRSHMTRAIRLARWLIPHAVRALQGGDATGDEQAVLRCVAKRSAKAGNLHGWVTRKEVLSYVTPARLRRSFDRVLLPLLRDLVGRGALEADADMAKFRLPVR